MSPSRKTDKKACTNALLEEMTWEKWQDWKHHEKVLENNRESVILNPRGFRNVPVTLQGMDQIRPFDGKALNRTKQAALAEAHKGGAGQPSCAGVWGEFAADWRVHIWQRRTGANY